MAREYDPGSDDITDYLLDSQREDLLDDLEIFLITDICQPDYFSAQEEIYSTVLGYVTSREEAIKFLVKKASPFARCSYQVNEDMAEQNKVVIYEDDEGERHYVNYELMKNLEE